MAETVARERKLVEQVVRTEVQNIINQARQRMPVDPDAVIQSLKLELDKIRQAPDLEADVRGQLVDQLQVALREGERRRVEFEQKRQQQQEAQAAGKERLLIQDNLARRQEQASQLMQRFSALMDEGRYRIAEDVAFEAQKVLPDSLTALDATMTSRQIGYLVQALGLRVARQKGVIDALTPVEKRSSRSTTIIRSSTRTPMFGGN